MLPAQECTVLSGETGHIFSANPGVSGSPGITVSDVLTRGLVLLNSHN